jgi:hypothetical protein
MPESQGIFLQYSLANLVKLLEVESVGALYFFSLRLVNIFSLKIQQFFNDSSGFPASEPVPSEIYAATSLILCVSTLGGGCFSDE